MRGSLTCGRKRVSARHDVFQLDMEASFVTGTSPALPSHQPGDLIVAGAGTGMTTDLPTADAGWNLLDSASGNNCAMVFYYRIATTSNHTITWTGSGGVGKCIWRLRHAALGDSAIVNGTGTTLDFPTLTITEPSFIGFFVFTRNALTDISTACTNLGVDFQTRINSNLGGANSSRLIADTGPISQPGVVTVLPTSFNPSDGTFDTTSNGYCAGAFAVNLN